VSKKKNLIAVPSAGLGNRMRVLSSCIQIAKKDQRDLYIAWPQNAALGCGIIDIFKSIGFDYKVPSKFRYFLLTQIYRHGAILKFPGVYKFFSRIFFDDAIFDIDTEFAQPKLNSEDASILIATCFSFGDKEDFRDFRFTDYLENRTDLEYQKIGVPYIGIHIRRTDHVDLIKHSPFENYLTHIDKCLAEIPAQKFYLATDDDETKKFLKERYGNSLHLFDHKLGRGDLEGIYGAVIDTAISIGGITEILHA